MSVRKTTPDVRSKLFPKRLVDINFVPDNTPEKSGNTGVIGRVSKLKYCRILQWVPPVEGHFEELRFAWPEGQEMPSHLWTRRSPEEQREYAKKKNSYRILDDDEAKALIAAEAERRLAWAKLSRHFFGEEQHSVSELQTQLGLTDEQLADVERRCGAVAKLVGTISSSDLERAKKELEEFRELHSPADIDDSRRLSRREEGLLQVVSEICEGQKRLKRIQKDHPLLFQTPDELNQIRSLTDEVSRDPRTTDTDAPQTSAPAGRSRKGAAGERLPADGVVAAGT